MKDKLENKSGDSLITSSPLGAFCKVVVCLTVFSTAISESHAVYLPITRYPSALNYWSNAEVQFVDKLQGFLKTSAETSANLSNLSHLNQTLEQVDVAMSDLFLRQVNSYLKDYTESFGGLRGFQSSNATVEDKVASVITNPLSAYRLMRRIVHLLPDVLDRIASINGFFGSQELVQFFPNRLDGWPRTEDIQDAMLGILRVNRVYNMDLTLFAEGNISGIVTGTKLHGIHCYEIGMHAYAQGFHTLAVEWLELGIAKARLDGTLEVPLIKSALNTAISRHDELFEDRWELDLHFFDRKLRPTSTDAQPPGPRRRQRDVLVETHTGQKSWTFNEINFAKLCSEGSFQSEAEKAKLFCWYETKAHPTWLVGPLKMELLATEPDVIQVYDVIGDRKINRIKEAAQPSMHLSRVVDSTSKAPGATTYSTVRTSVGTWLEEKYDSKGILPPIPYHIEQITGLKVASENSSEMLQVASYTFSGHYEVHLDALITPLQYGYEKGDRVATFMYYLTDVELGGKTAFVQAGTVANPVKGSAVFWYDIHRDGEADYWTYHGACPVILGQKWVSNKWIRLYDQFLTHQCSSRGPKDRFRVKVNGNVPDLTWAPTTNQTLVEAPSHVLIESGLEMTDGTEAIEVDLLTSKNEL